MFIVVVIVVVFVVVKHFILHVEIVQPSCIHHLSSHSRPIFSSSGSSEVRFRLHMQHLHLCINVVWSEQLMGLGLLGSSLTY